MPRKKQKQKGAPPHINRPGGGRKPGPTSTSQAHPRGAKQNLAKDSKQSVQQNQRPIVPFLRGDRILLVGEGECRSSLSSLVVGIYTVEVCL